MRHDHDQSIPTISEDQVLSHTSIQSSQRKSRTLPSSRTPATTTATTKNIDENKNAKKIPVILSQAKNDHENRNALYFSQSISVLNEYDCGLKMEMKHIHSTINNEGFQNLVYEAYNRLVEVRPHLIYLGVTYVPVARPHRGDADVHYTPHDKDDVTEFL